MSVKCNYSNRDYCNSVLYGGNTNPLLSIPQHAGLIQDNICNKHPRPLSGRCITSIMMHLLQEVVFYTLQYLQQLLSTNHIQSMSESCSEHAATQLLKNLSLKKKTLTSHLQYMLMLIYKQQYSKNLLAVDTVYFTQPSLVTCKKIHMLHE